MSIFKILIKEELKLFQNTLKFYGNSKDLSSKFIHMSYKNQIPDVYYKHYINEEAFILEINPIFYKSNIKYELAKNGQLYPHIYNTPLIYSSVKSIGKLHTDFLRGLKM
uniref:Uncharacterized protein n=1 Tax=viral metagenome TaxID=1070528 RepID=A0A6C0AF92_9ZZZZ